MAPLFRALPLLAVARGAVLDDDYDCRLRALALDYARDVVLHPWPAARAKTAAALVEQGLNIVECGRQPSVHSESAAKVQVGNAQSAELYVSPTGDDAGQGSRDAPLRTLDGARGRIRKLWPEVASRPPVSVLMRGGTYFNVSTRFDAADSGSSSEGGIVYMSALDDAGEPEPVVLSGGINLNSYHLTWKAAGPPGAFRARLPDGAARPDVQDQLFVGGRPMVRARVPNGKPWLPLDGFSLHVGKNYSVAHEPLPNTPTAIKACTGQADAFPCEPVKAMCAGTGAVQWPMGHANSEAFLGSSSFAELGGVVEVTNCYEHHRTDQDWPADWRAAAFGYEERDNATHTWMNKMDVTHNLPITYGPWAGGMAVDVTQDAGGLDLSSLSWKGPSSIVVHAMQDQEWGGCQFRVADTPVERSGDNALLRFQHGGWQQARTAEMYLDAKEQSPHGSRFYMEGSLEFFDSEGEWHLDEDMLYVFPPADLHLDGDALAQVEVVLTQSDRILEFIGNKSSFVRNIAVANLTLSQTSAQFFRPHEETSGGDYTVHRGGAVFAENAADLTFVGNSFEHIGGNAVFLSNAVSGVRISSNLFRFLGTNGVSMVGRTGTALGDGRDGDAMVARHGAERDNGVRLPRGNTVDHNVFTDWGIWDKQSACFHRALAPDNVFLNNICFNASRHAVNYQDVMGGGGAVEGNLVFNLNRETRDTSAFNSWGRRTYLLSDYDTDPAVPRIVPAALHSWRRNFILNRNFHDVGYDQQGNNALRNDDGASWFNHSSNVMYNAGIQFNGGSQSWSHGNLFIRGGWTLCSFLDVGGSSHDTFVDTEQSWRAVCGNAEHDRCKAFLDAPDATGERPATYRGDHNLAIQNSTGRAEKVEWAEYWCGMDLASWQAGTGQDASTTEANGGPDWTPERVIELARQKLWSENAPPPSGHDQSSEEARPVLV